MTFILLTTLNFPNFFYDCLLIISFFLSCYNSLPVVFSHIDPSCSWLLLATSYYWCLLSQLNCKSLGVWDHTLCCFCILSEKAMAPHSSTLAWKTPWTEEPGGLQSMGSLRVRDDWATSLSLFSFTHWRRKWQPTPVILPRESQGRRSLVGCHLWGRTESNTTEAT